MRGRVVSANRLQNGHSKSENITSATAALADPFVAVLARDSGSAGTASLLRVRGSLCEGPNLTHRTPKASTNTAMVVTVSNSPLAVTDERCLTGATSFMGHTPAHG